MDIDYVKNHLASLSYKSFLAIGREFVEYQLEDSLMNDLRIYGAEFIEDLIESS